MCIRIKWITFFWGFYLTSPLLCFWNVRIYLCQSQGLECIFFKGRAVEILLKCSIKIWRCTHDLHISVTPIPCSCFQCWMFSVHPLLLPQFTSTHCVYWAEWPLPGYSKLQSGFPFFCPFKPCCWRLVAMVTSLAVLKNKYKKKIRLFYFYYFIYESAAAKWHMTSVTNFIFWSLCCFH